MRFDLEVPGRRERASSPGERWFLAIFCLLLFGGFAAELLRDLEPSRLGVPFFFVAWILLTIVHEAGHAVVARLLGWRVHQVTLGFGPLVRRFRVGGAPVELRAFPITGFVWPVPTRLRRARLTSALVYFAGPGVELLVVAALAAAFGVDTLLTRSESVAIIAAQSTAVAALLGAGLNLLPITGPGGAWSDGLGILMSPLLDRRHFEHRMAAPHVVEGRERLDQGDAEGALRCFERGLDRFPGVSALHVGAAFALAALGRRGEALLALNAQRQRADLTVAERREIEAALTAVRDPEA